MFACAASARLLLIFLLLARAAPACLLLLLLLACVAFAPLLSLLCLLLQQPPIVPLRCVSILKAEIFGEHQLKWLAKLGVRQSIGQVVVNLHIAGKVPHLRHGADVRRARLVLAQPVHHLVIPKEPQLLHQPLPILPHLLIDSGDPVRVEVDAPVPVDSGGGRKLLAQAHRGGVEGGRKPRRLLRRVHPRRTHPRLNRQVAHCRFFSWISRIAWRAAPRTPPSLS